MLLDAFEVFDGDFVDEVVDEGKADGEGLEWGGEGGGGGGEVVLGFGQVMEWVQFLGQLN